MWASCWIDWFKKRLWKVWMSVRALIIIAGSNTGSSGRPDCPRLSSITQDLRYITSMTETDLWCIIHQSIIDIRHGWLSVWPCIQRLAQPLSSPFPFTSPLRSRKKRTPQALMMLQSIILHPWHLINCLHLKVFKRFFLWKSSNNNYVTHCLHALQIKHFAVCSGWRFQL